MEPTMAEVLNATPTGDTPASSGKLLVVVSRDRAEAYDATAWHFSDLADVIIDRRCGDRRREHAAAVAAGDRRRFDRRGMRPDLDRIVVFVR